MTKVLQHVVVLSVSLQLLFLPFGVLTSPTAAPAAGEGGTDAAVPRRQQAASSSTSSANAASGAVTCAATVTPALSRESDIAVDRIFPLSHESVSPTRIHVGGCVHLLTGGWWRYEWCPGRWIRQYHEVNNVIRSEYYLGVGASALRDDKVGRQKLKYTDGEVPARVQVGKLQNGRAANNPASPDCSDSDLPVQAALTYNDGTLCDVTHRPRRTRVTYVCDELTEAFKWNISEVRDCEYHIVAVGVLACQMLGLQPPYHVYQSGRGPAVQGEDVGEADMVDDAYLSATDLLKVIESRGHVDFLAEITPPSSPSSGGVGSSVEGAPASTAATTNAAAAAHSLSTTTDDVDDSELIFAL